MHLKYSKIRVNSSFPRFLSIIDYNSNIEAVLMNRSRKISSSSRLKVLELDIFRDRGQRPRSNSPIAVSKFLDYFSTAFYPRREKSTWVGLNSGSLAPQAAALTNRSWLLKNDGPSLPLLGTQIPSFILIAWLCPREDSDKRQKDSLLTLYIWH